MQSPLRNKHAESRPCILICSDYLCLLIPSCISWHITQYHIAWPGCCLGHFRISHIHPVIFWSILSDLLSDAFLMMFCIGSMFPQVTGGTHRVCQLAISLRFSAHCPKHLQWSNFIHDWVVRFTLQSSIEHWFMRFRKWILREIHVVSEKKKRLLFHIRQTCFLVKSLK